MTQDYKIVSRISVEDAHEVAMVAARLIQPSVMDGLTHKEAAAMVAEAYLQAYEAVEGWTKPEPQLSRDKPTRDDPAHPDYYTRQAEMLTPFKIDALQPKDA